MRQASRSRSAGRKGAQPGWRSEIHKGCTVSLKGLNVQRNGQRGVVESFVESTGRWRVKLQGSGTVKDFKPENVVLEQAAALPPCKIWETAKAQTSQVEGTKPQREAQEAELCVGAEICLHGLKSAVELNGQIGTIEAFMQDTGRWRVKLSSGQVKDLKGDNLKRQAASVLEEAAKLDAELAGSNTSEFNIKVGDVFGPGNRFIVQEKLGEGIFSTVFRCKDAQTSGVEYAIKFTRASAATRQALEKELKLMRLLQTQVGHRDPDGVRCLLSLAFFEGFEYQGRLGAAFELMKCNLCTAVEKYGKGKGLPLLPTVRNFGKNLFTALRALANVGIVHSDVKPTNLLLSRDNESVKLSDFGSCLGVKDKVNTDELQPRHYRSPEVILGQDFDAKIDVWSAAATLYEIATDVVLFEGETNNEMIHEMLKVCGAFPSRFSTAGVYALNHFHANSDFLNAKGDMAVGSVNPRIMPMTRFDPPTRPIHFLLEEALKVPARGVPPERHAGLVQHLGDLLGKCLLPEPSGRATAELALSHRFFQKGA